MPLPGRCAGCREPVYLAMWRPVRDEQGGGYHIALAVWLNKADGQPHTCRRSG